MNSLRSASTGRERIAASKLVRQIPSSIPRRSSIESSPLRVRDPSPKPGNAGKPNNAKAVPKKQSLATAPISGLRVIKPPTSSAARRRGPKPCILLELPSEVRVQVFLFLSLADILRMDLTCKDLRQAAQSAELWRILCGRFLPNVSPELIESKVKASQPSLLRESVLAVIKKKRTARTDAIRKQIRTKYTARDGTRKDADIVTALNLVFELSIGGRKFDIGSIGPNAQLFSTSACLRVSFAADDVPADPPDGTGALGYRAGAQHAPNPLATLRLGVRSVETGKTWIAIEDQRFRRSMWRQVSSTADNSLILFAAQDSRVIVGVWNPHPTPLAAPSLSVDGVSSAGEGPRSLRAKQRAAEEAVRASQWSLAFVMINIPLCELVQTAIFNAVPERPPPDDLDPQYGLHGYTVLVELRRAGVSFWSNTFYDVFSDPSSPPTRERVRCSVFPLVKEHDSGTNAAHAFSGLPSFLWKTYAFAGQFDDVALLDLVLLDERRVPMWTASRLVQIEAGRASDRFEYADSTDRSITLRLHEAGQGELVVQLSYSPPYVEALSAAEQRAQDSAVKTAKAMRLRTESAEGPFASAKAKMADRPGRCVVRECYLKLTHSFINSWFGTQLPV